MAQTLQEYLVELGFDVDKKSLDQFNTALNSADQNTESFAKRTVNNMRTAATAVTGLFAGIATAASKMFSSYADLDTATERQARQWWTTEENARSLTDALDAMGESFDDIYTMTPEQYQNMMELKNFSSSIRAPAELQGALNVIKEAQQETRKLRVLFREAGNWIIYYFAKFMGGDTQKLIDGYKSFVEYLTQKMPKITQTIARVLYYVFRLGKAGVEMASRVKDSLSHLFDSLPTKTKMAGAAVTGFIALFKAGPVGIFIATIAALLLLMDDYLTWERGGKSALPGLWEGLGNLKENPVMQKYLDLLLDIVNAAADLGISVGKLVVKIIEVGDRLGIWETLGTLIKTTFEWTAKLVDELTDLLDIIGTDEYKGLTSDEASTAATQKNIEAGGDGNLTWWQMWKEALRYQVSNSSWQKDENGFGWTFAPEQSGTNPFMDFQGSYNNKAAGVVTNAQSTTNNNSTETTTNNNISINVTGGSSGNTTQTASQIAQKVRAILD